MGVTPSSLAKCDATLPRDQQCGGHGSCSPTTFKCTCDADWSISADFLSPNEECGLSLTGIRLLWAASVLEILIILYQVSWIIVLRIESFMEERKKKRGYTLWKNKGLLSLLIFLTISMPSQFIMAVAHLVNPEMRIGFDGLPTALFFLGKAGLYIAAPLFQGPLLSSALKTEKRFQRTVRYNYVFQGMINGISMILGTFGIITYVNFQNSPEQQIQIMYTYYFLQASALFSQSVQAALVLWHVNRVLDKAAGIIVSSGQDSKTSSIRAKINEVQKAVGGQAFLQSILYIIMGAVPFLFNKHAYFLPFSWIAMPILVKRAALQYNLDAKSAAKTIRQRLGLQKTTEMSSAQNPTSLGVGKKEGSQVSFNIEDTKIATTTQQGTFGGRGGSEFTPKGGKKKKNRQGNRSTALSHEMEQLGDVLSEQGEYRDRFTAFVRSKYASEALELYDACHIFKIRATNPTVKAKEIEKLGRKIIADFVADDAPKAVDMPDLMRKALLGANASGKFNDHTFDSVRMLAFDLLRSNFYFQFVNHIERQEELLKQQAAMGPKKTSAAKQITPLEMGRKKPSMPTVAAYMQQ